MFTFIIIAAAAAIAIAIRISSLNDVSIAKAKTAGTTPVLLNGANPIHWIKAIFGAVSYAGGYAPRAAKRGLDETRKAIKEANLELKEANIQVEASAKAMYRAGKLTSANHHNKRISDLQKQMADLDIKLAK